MDYEAIMAALDECPQFCYGKLTANGENRRYCAVGWLLHKGGMTVEEVETLAEYGDSADFIFFGYDHYSEDEVVTKLREKAIEILADEYGLGYGETEFIMKLNDEMKPRPYMEGGSTLPKDDVVGQIASHLKEFDA